MKAIRKILVPTDLSDFSLAAIDYARSLARVYDANVTLLHVLDFVPVMSYPTIDFTLETALQDKEEQAKGTIKSLLADNFRDFDPVIVVRRGVAYQQIMKFTSDESVDLIVMGTHGRTGLPHVILGSVAEKVVRHSPVPVLTVKPSSMKQPLIEEWDVEEQLHIKSL